MTSVNDQDNTTDAPITIIFADPDVSNSDHVQCTIHYKIITAIIVLSLFAVSFLALQYASKTLNICGNECIIPFVATAIGATVLFISCRYVCVYIDETEQNEHPI